MLDKTLDNKEIHWNKKYEILKEQAIRDFFLKNERNVFLEYCTENEISDAIWNIEGELKYIRMHNPLGLLTNDLPKLINWYLVEKKNWKFEYLKMPIYSLSDFEIDGSIEENEKRQFEEFRQKNKEKKYSVLEVHQILKDFKNLSGVKFDINKNEQEDSPKRRMYDMYSSNYFNKELEEYFREKELTKIEDNGTPIEVIQYVKYHNEDDLYM